MEAVGLIWDAVETAFCTFCIRLAALSCNLMLPFDNGPYMTICPSSLELPGQHWLKCLDRWTLVDGQS